jgi:hypothetical protein
LTTNPIGGFRRTWDPGRLPLQDKALDDAQSREIWTSAAEEGSTGYMVEIPRDMAFQDPFDAFACDWRLSGRIGFTALAFDATWTVLQPILGGCLRPANPLPGGCLCPADLRQASALPSWLLSPLFRENGGGWGSVVDGVSHSRFDSPASFHDVSHVHVLHTAPQMEAGIQRRDTLLQRP